jgi:hypothetical protein
MVFDREKNEGGPEEFVKEIQPEPQHIMLPRVDLPKGSTTPTPDFAPLDPACRISSSLLWTRNRVHDLCLVRGIQNLQFYGDQSKED